MTIEEQARTITTAPNFYAIGVPLEAIARALHAEALDLQIAMPGKREDYVHQQLVRLDKLCGWDVLNRTQEVEESIYGMLAHIAELAWQRGV